MEEIKSEHEKALKAIQQEAVQWRRAYEALKDTAHSTKQCNAVLSLRDHGTNTTRETDTSDKRGRRLLALENEVQTLRELQRKWKVKVE